MRSPWSKCVNCRGIWVKRTDIPHTSSLEWNDWMTAGQERRRLWRIDKNSWRPHWSLGPQSSSSAQWTPSWLRLRAWSHNSARSFLFLIQHLLRNSYRSTRCEGDLWFIFVLRKVSFEVIIVRGLHWVQYKVTQLLDLVSQHRAENVVCELKICRRHNKSRVMKSRRHGYADKREKRYRSETRHFKQLTSISTL